MKKLAVLLTWQHAWLRLALRATLRQLWLALVCLAPISDACGFPSPRLLRAEAGRSPRSAVRDLPLAQAVSWTPNAHQGVGDLCHGRTARTKAQIQIQTPTQTPDHIDVRHNTQSRHCPIARLRINDVSQQLPS